MKIALFYFSGTGNTKFVCDRFTVFIEQGNHSIDLYNIELIRNESIDTVSTVIDQADLIGFAYPVHGANLPKIMDNFLNSFFLDGSKNKDVFIISTVGVINAYGPYIIKKRLQRSGLNLKWHFVYRTINNTAVRKVERKQLEEKHRNQMMRFSKFCNSVIANKTYYNGIGPWILGGYFVRRMLRKPIANHYKAFYVDSSLCTKCNLCIDSCPTKSITYQHTGFVFSQTCTTCLRCINTCPVNAIKDGHVKHIS